MTQKVDKLDNPTSWTFMTAFWVGTGGLELIGMAMTIPVPNVHLLWYLAAASGWLSQSTASK